MFAPRLRPSGEIGALDSEGRSVYKIKYFTSSIRCKLIQALNMLVWHNHYMPVCVGERHLAPLRSETQSKHVCFALSRPEFSLRRTECSWFVRVLDGLPVT